MAENRILLVDCDMFFVQVARLEDPEGAGRARLLLVGGSPSGRGVVTSASYEARAYGVTSAMSTAQALRLCPDAVVVGVPRRACQQKSREVRDVLQLLSPVVQPASIDEFYLDLAGTERLFQGEALRETARRIRETVLERTSISVSVGGGSTKLMAKLAVRQAKPGGVHVVEPEAEEDFLRAHDLATLPGVGPSLAERLRAKGLVTVEDALRIDEEWLSRWLGRRRGRWLHQRIRGIDSSRVNARDARKSISSERTFFQDLESDLEIDRQLIRLASSVGRSLRAKGLRARTVTVKVRAPDFATRQSGYTLPTGIESDAAILAVARNLLGELRRRRRTSVRLLGVGLSTLIDADDPLQMALFEDDATSESRRDRAVSHLMDDLRERFGERAIGPGATLE